MSRSFSASRGSARWSSQRIEIEDSLCTMQDAPPPASGRNKSLWNQVLTTDPNDRRGIPGSTAESGPRNSRVFFLLLYILYIFPRLRSLTLVAPLPCKANLKTSNPKTSDCLQAIFHHASAGCPLCDAHRPGHWTPCVATRAEGSLPPKKAGVGVWGGVFLDTLMFNLQPWED